MKKVNGFAKRNGYLNIQELLMDYGILPSVLMPKNKKIEIIKLFFGRKK